MLQQFSLHLPGSRLVMSAAVPTLSQGPAPLHSATASHCESKMQQHLGALVSAIGALPAAGGAASRSFHTCCRELHMRLAELAGLLDRSSNRRARQQLVGLLRELGQHGGAAAALGQRIQAASGGGGNNKAFKAHRECAFGLAVLGIATVDALEGQRAPGSALSEVELGGLLSWPAAVLPAAVAVLNAVAQQRQTIESSGSAGFLQYSMDVIFRYVCHVEERSAHGTAYTAALQGVQQQMTPLLVCLTQAMGTLAKPGQEGYAFENWGSTLKVLHGLLSEHVVDATVAALSAASEQHGSLGTQLIEVVLTRLAVEVEQLSTAAAAAAVAGEAEEQQYRVSTRWHALSSILRHTRLGPTIHAVLARGTYGRQTVRRMAGLLAQLDQQLATLASQLSPVSATVYVEAAMVAAVVIGAAAQAHVQAYRHQQRAYTDEQNEQQQGLLQARCDSAANAVWEAFNSLRPAAAVLSALVAVGGYEVLNKALLPLDVLGALAVSPDPLFTQFLKIRAFSPWDQELVGRLASGHEAMVRCAARLQQSMPAGLAAACLNLSHAAAHGCDCSINYCRYWMAVADPEIISTFSRDAAECVLSHVAALASTACKFAAVCASAGAAAEGEPASTSEAAAAEREATSGGPSNKHSTESHLLSILTLCVHLAEGAAERAISMSVRSESLLRCIRLMHAEGSSRLLPHVPLDVRAGQRSFAHAVAPMAQQEGEEGLISARALAETARCANMGCINLEGSTDAGLPAKRCGGCRLQRYCSTACQHADWRRHKRQCRLLAAQRVTEQPPASTEQGAAPLESQAEHGPGLQMTGPLAAGRASRHLGERAYRQAVAF